jgi:hypothetical protein
MSLNEIQRIAVIGIRKELRNGQVNRLFQSP